MSNDEGTEIIFHQYAASPFSEKIRKVLAHKNVAYRSVEQPMWMPKPHLTPLTGGYRRIPVMQIGADVYCDTACIARKLEALCPEPTIYPDGNVGAAEGFAAWADRQLFMACVPLVFAGLAELLPAELIEDRKRMRPDLDPEELRKSIPDLRTALRAHCDAIDRGLEGRTYVLGDRFSIADAALYHCLWFARNVPECAAMIDDRPKLRAWMKRLDDMGAGNPTSMDPDRALDIARSESPATEKRRDPGDPNGLEPGMKVGVCSDDLPSDVFEGEVLALDARELVILRNDGDLGEIAIHFPRVGYLVKRTG